MRLYPVQNTMGQKKYANAYESDPFIKITAAYEQQKCVIHKRKGCVINLIPHYYVPPAAAALSKIIQHVTSVSRSRPPMPGVVTQTTRARVVRCVAVRRRTAVRPTTIRRRRRVVSRSNGNAERDSRISAPCLRRSRFQLPADSVRRKWNNNRWTWCRTTGVSAVNKRSTNTTGTRQINLSIILSVCI